MLRPLSVRLTAIAALAALSFVAAPETSAKASVWAEGHNPWLGRELSRDALLPPLESGAYYLLRNQLEDGSFVYIKDPLGKNAKRKKDAYSLIRHLGAVYSLLRAYELLQDAKLLDGSRRGIDFIRRFREEEGGQRIVKSLSGKVSLGENGFLLINQVLYDKLTGGKAYAEESGQLESFLKKALLYGGPFATKGQWAESQALIGLAHYHLFQRKDDEAIEVARRFLTAMMVDERFSHWSVQAQYFYGLMVDFKDHASNAYALESAQKLLEGVATQGKETVKPRLVGARRGKLVSCNATARNEGLIAAHMIAQATGNAERASFFLSRAKEHVAYAMQFQYGQRGNVYADDPQMSRLGRLFNMAGGVVDDPEDAFVRIDYVSHHLRAIAAFLASPQAPKAVGLSWKDLEPFGPPAPKASTAH
jgi:hypothetical protein